jgi:polysaccharide biosynthesis/export protein
MLTFGQIPTTQRQVNMRIVLLLVVVITGLSSCTINRNFMFRTDKEYVFDKPLIDSNNVEYIIGPNDVIMFDLYTNDGAMILEYTTSGTETPKFSSGLELHYYVDAQGNVDFPIIGNSHVAGMSIAALRTFLEKSYSQFNFPYAVVRVLNRRIIIFNGPNGEGKVVPLENTNTSVIEALALGGGLSVRGNARQIKLIRSIESKQEVYEIDLSTIDGIKYANMPVMAGDIIYIEPTPQLGAEIAKDVQPYFQIFTGLVLAVSILRRVQ